LPVWSRGCWLSSGCRRVRIFLWFFILKWSNKMTRKH
jgi:hypothetical protein